MRNRDPRYVLCFVSAVVCVAGIAVAVVLNKGG